MTREEAIARIENHMSVHKIHEIRAVKITEALNMAISALKQPEQKTGKWFDVGSLSCRCSECGCKSSKEFRYCPNCGAKMEKDGERWRKMELEE